MAAIRHLKNAPAREALIDIQFEPSISAEEIQKFADVVGSKFEQQTDLWESTVGFQVGVDAEAQTNSSHNKIGKRFDSNKPAHVLQCRKNGFTFSILYPYRDWEDLKSEAQQYWNQLQSVSKLGSVTRIAVRYINEINLPLPITSFSEYLTSAPNIPAALPQGLAGFLQRCVIPIENGAVSIVTTSFEGINAEQQIVTILLDIDVFKSVSLNSRNFDEVWVEMEFLRSQKNKFFFEYLTEKALEKYE